MSYKPLALAPGSLTVSMPADICRQVLSSLLGGTENGIMMLLNQPKEKMRPNMDTNSPLNIFITGGASGVARETTRQAVARGHKVTVLTEGLDGATKARQDGALPAFSDVTRAGELKSHSVFFDRFCRHPA